jgi:predicted Zn-dependent protease
MVGLCEFQTREYDAALRHLLRGRALGLGDNKQLESASRYHAAILLSRAQQFEQATDLLSVFAREGNRTDVVIEATGAASLRLPVLPGEISSEKREMVMLAGKAVSDANATRVELAAKGFAELVSRFPDTPNVHYLRGWFLLLNKHEGGIAELKREIEVSPQHAPARIAIAFEYLRLGDVASALPYAQEGVALAPNSFVAHNAYGRTLLQQGNVAKGIAELEIATKLAPQRPENRYALASAYAKAGRKEDAARERAAFVKLNEVRRN